MKGRVSQRLEHLDRLGHHLDLAGLHVLVDHVVRARANATADRDAVLELELGRGGLELGRSHFCKWMAVSSKSAASSFSIAAQAAAIEFPLRKCRKKRNSAAVISRQAGLLFALR